MSAPWEEFPLAGDDAVTPEAEVAGAAQSALDAADGSVAPPVQASPEPFGMTWQMDPQTGRLARAGGTPITVSGVGALAAWAVTTLCTRRGAWPLFSAAYGVDGLTELTGRVVTGEDLAEVADWIREALTVHDRISDVEDVRVSVGRLSALFGVAAADDAAAVFIENFTIVTDEGERLPVGGITIPGSN